MDTKQPAETEEPGLDPGDRWLEATLEEARAAFEQGDRSQLMHCVFLCARFELVMPQWMADALLKLEDDLRTGRLKDFNEAFGKPQEKTSARDARARKEKARAAIKDVLFHLRTREGSSLTESVMLGRAMEMLKARGIRVNGRDVEEFLRSAEGDFIRELPRGPYPEGTNFAHGELVLSRPRRYGRKMFKD